MNKVYIPYSYLVATMSTSISKLKIVRINRHFNKTTKKIYRRNEISMIIKEYGPIWKLKNIRTPTFIDIMVNKSELSILKLLSEGTYPPIIRYAWGQDFTLYELALSLKKNSYFSHSTAVFLHGLTNNNPQTIYINSEQSPKPKKTHDLTQQAIDQAFQYNQRSSKYVFIYKKNRIVILSGKNTKQFGVINLPHDHMIRTTSIERTIIDITVRPHYAGGVKQVLSTIHTALGKISLQKLIDTLNTLDYVYPYHQALGFYLERAGLKEKDLHPLRSLGLEFNFYLAHGMNNTAFDPTWHIHYPKNL